MNDSIDSVPSQYRNDTDGEKSFPTYLSAQTYVRWGRYVAILTRFSLGMGNHWISALPQRMSTAMPLTSASLTLALPRLEWMTFHESKPRWTRGSTPDSIVSVLS